MNMMEKPRHPGKLYIVATPIGNPKDITLRALDVLKSVDAVICEELRLGSRLLNRLGIEQQLIPLNEHNESAESARIVDRLLAGESFALISDAGTPVFADPGQQLLQLIYKNNVAVTSVPGAASLMAALSLCDFPIDQFIFAGFPPQKSEQRSEFLKQYVRQTAPIVLMDTPYRLTKLLEEVVAIFGKDQDLLLASDLTLPGETILRGKAGDILEKVSGQKREFILILNLNRHVRRH